MICGVSKIGLYIRLIDNTIGGIGNRAEETPQSLCDSSPINKQGSRRGDGLVFSGRRKAPTV